MRKPSYPNNVPGPLILGVWGQKGVRWDLYQLCTHGGIIGLKTAMWPNGVQGCLSWWTLLWHVAFLLSRCLHFAKGTLQEALRHAVVFLLTAEPGQVGCFSCSQPGLFLAVICDCWGIVQMDKWTISSPIPFPLSAASASTSCQPLPTSSPLLLCLFSCSFWHF